MGAVFEPGGMVMNGFSRRSVVAGGLAAGAVTLGGSAGEVHAQTTTTLTGVTWGGPWIAACKEISERQKAESVTWILHEGSAANTIAKISASWPRPQIDLVHAWPPVFYRMLREGWLEPITEADVPNLAKMPPELLIKNDKGQVVTVPVSGTASFWSYDQAAAGLTIEKPEDLFSPKLRGRILMSVPSFEVGRTLMSLALSRGGNERNMDPGFEFAKELAKAKMIGRVVKSDTEVINAFTSGEVVLGMTNLGNYNEIRKSKMLTSLNRMTGSKMFKTFVSHEGFVVLTSSDNKKATMEFINFFINASNNTEYTARIGHVALNSDSTVSPAAAVVQLKDSEERQKFGYFADLAYASEQLPDWNRRWELDVAPLLRG